jgi:signal transduction histidine kinase
MKMLAKVYQAKGMYAQAADLALQYVNKQDTLYKNNLADEVASIEGRHETFVKDQQIALLHRNVEVQNLSLREKDLLVERRTLLGAILALALIGIFGFYYFYTKRKQLLKEADYQRRLLEEQQERHAAALAAENAERKRIARELHDGVGQMIASVRLHMAARATPTNTYTDLETMLAETSNEVRFISHNLMPQALERKGFDAAIEEFCERLSRTKKIEVVSHVEPVGEQLTPDRAQMLYRVLQELVSNVLKHAQAKTVYVTLTIDGDEVCLTVEDDGVGFDQQQPTESGIGLENLKDRVASVGGQLDVDAKLGRGSLFSIRVGAVSIQSEHRTAYV